MNKEKRVKVAQETLEVLKSGSYVSANGEVVEIATFIQSSKDRTTLHELATMPSLTQAAYQYPTDIQVTAETTIEALIRLKKAGYKDIGCLNFASAKNPGGGFLGGAVAQEEVLARSSALYPTLLEQPEYYSRNRNNRSTFYLDMAIVSPEVAFIRSDDGLFLDEPVVATVITSPAPNAGAIANSEPSRLNQIPEAIAVRAEMVLRLFLQSGIRHVVLGAWGCGVFRNDPTVMADTFAKLLSEDGIYQGRFQTVVFAVPVTEKSSTNHDAFRDRFWIRKFQ